jgi:hypothetical protein
MKSLGYLMGLFLGLCLVVIGFAAPAWGAPSNGDNWTAFAWTNGNSISPQATFSGQPVNFNFEQGKFTALLVSSSKRWTGDLTGKTLTEDVTLTPGSTFADRNGGGCTPDLQKARLFFQSPGFAFTNFWWSTDPNSITLTPVGGTFHLSVSLTDPSQWSDFNGKNGATEVTGFNDAVSKVSTVGLSFGGGCFFENGVTITSGSATLTSNFSESP